MGESQSRQKKIQIEGRRERNRKIWRVVAWLNFGLAFAGLLKFLPVVILTVRSLWSNTSHLAWTWSVDLISDTHWIFLVWLSVTLAVRHFHGRFLLRPWKD